MKATFQVDRISRIKGETPESSLAIVLVRNADVPRPLPAVAVRAPLEGTELESSFETIQQRAETLTPTLRTILMIGSSHWGINE